MKNLLFTSNIIFSINKNIMLQKDDSMNKNIFDDEDNAFGSQYPITSEGFAESIPIDEEIINKYMKKYNFIVCSVLISGECQKTIEQTWNEMNTLGNGKLNPNDPTTWENENWPLPNHIYLSNHVTTTEQSFINMVNPNIVKIFEILHKTNKLYPSTSITSIKRPLYVNGVKKSDWVLNPLRLHFDRDSNENYDKYPPRYQGLISLVDSGYDIGSFAAVPGSANEVIKNPNLWLNVDQGKYIKTGKESGYLHKYLQKIPMKAGDMIIWDKSVAHSNFPNNSDKPRITQFFTYIPAAKYAIELNENNVVTYSTKHKEYKDEIMKYKWNDKQKQLLGLKKY